MFYPAIKINLVPTCKYVVFLKDNLTVKYNGVCSSTEDSLSIIKNILEISSPGLVNTTWKEIFPTTKVTQTKTKLIR